MRPYPAGTDSWWVCPVCSAVLPHYLITQWARHRFTPPTVTLTWWLPMGGPRCSHHAQGRCGMHPCRTLAGAPPPVTLLSPPPTVTLTWLLPMQGPRCSHTCSGVVLYASLPDPGLCPTPSHNAPPPQLSHLHGCCQCRGPGAPTRAQKRCCTHPFLCLDQHCHRHQRGRP